MQVGLICGESAGLISAKKILSIKKIKIIFIISADKKYDTAIKKICLQNKITFFNKKQFKKKNFLIYLKKIDYLLSIFSNIIVPKDYLNVPKKMCINLHPALLPYYKGINVISGVIYNKEKITGLTLHKMDEKVDSGKIILIKKINITNQENALTLMNKLKKKTPHLINYFFKKIIKKNKILLRDNNNKFSKKFPKYIPNDGLIDLKQTACKILRIFKASYYGPYLSSWGKLRININKADYVIKNLKIINRKNKLQKKIEKINENHYIVQSKDKILKITI
jgi:methionyl-tRNA formyltransferase